ncbi:FliO/MopB family protein [Leifsonia sp. Leaf264]|uniref:FliO/MopB family protein n=1 Tax=Leifsonia sp. Leaf264 TaxID=1736314 RepID=UPI0007004236|nr:flagellar biosynthetic protein FliO [Leifsonia sp. Leaf264]KQO98245.1 hypothetical protein ASF30_09295 [Leifsonia sp. Leaf264]
MDLPSILRVVISLVAVFGAIWWTRKKLLGGKTATLLRKQQLVKVVSRTSLGKSASAVIIDTDGRRLLLGVTEHGVSVLRDSEAPTEPVFDAVLAAADLSLAEGEAEAAAPADKPAPTKTTKKPASQGSLSGSILSPDTWKKSGAALGVGAKK